MDSVGNIYQEGFEDNILVQSIDHAMAIPTDPQSGQPSGQRVHSPFVITKVIDKSSPLLCTALSSGERLSKCEIHLYRTSVDGTQEHYYTIKLIDAIIVSISTSMPHAQNPATAYLTHLESVAFSYRAIQWNHEVCGTSGEDDWRKPIAG